MGRSVKHDVSEDNAVMHLCVFAGGLGGKKLENDALCCVDRIRTQQAGADV